MPPVLELWLQLRRILSGSRTLLIRLIGSDSPSQLDRNRGRRYLGWSKTKLPRRYQNTDNANHAPNDVLYAALVLISLGPSVTNSRRHPVHRRTQRLRLFMLSFDSASVGLIARQPINTGTIKVPAAGISRTFLRGNVEALTSATN